MKAYTAEELKIVLKKHKLWLDGNPEGEKANLSGSHLFEANLNRANLRRANLNRANLSGASLFEVDFSDADLGGANLRGADFSRANLCGADLRGANFSEANLNGAYLSGSNIVGANLSGAIDGAVCRMDFGGWSICVRSKETSIGCQTHPNEKWLEWTPDSSEIKKMHSGASEWWRKHQAVIKEAIRDVMNS